MSKPKLNRTELAAFFEKSLPTIDSWVRKGCPVLQRGGRGREWLFNPADVAEWRIDSKVAEATGATQASYEELKSRKLLAEVQLAEIEAAKARDEVLGVEFVKLNLSNLFEEVKTNLRNVPGRVVSSIVGNTNEREIKELLLTEIDIALTALADGPVLIQSTNEEHEYE